MTRHLIRLAVGADLAGDIEAYHCARGVFVHRPSGRLAVETTTRRMPRERAAVIDGGSLFWVVKGVIAIRQPVLDIEAITGEDGRDYARLVLAASWVPVVATRHRPFQGWRYFDPAAAPPDAAAAVVDDSVPLINELAALGLL